MILKEVVAGRCRGRKTASSKASAAPKECPTNVTDAPECAAKVVCTADRISDADLNHSGVRPTPMNLKPKAYLA